MLHAHVFFTIPLGSSDMTQSDTDQHECGVAIGESPQKTKLSPNEMFEKFLFWILAAVERRKKTGIMLDILVQSLLRP